MSNQYRDIVHSLGFKLFETSYSNASLSKQVENLLKGLNHYFEEGTRKCFGASVSRISVSNDGLTLKVLERVSADYEHSKKVYRVVLFDFTGEIINDRLSTFEAHKNLKSAQKDFEGTYVNSFDVLQNAIEREIRKRTRALNQANDAQNAMRGIIEEMSK